MAEVHIHLDADGLPERTFAIRPAMESGQFVEREWHGVFSDYHERQDRLVPHRGAVAWTYEGERFEVWKGAIEEWRKE